MVVKILGQGGFWWTLPLLPPSSSSFCKCSTTAATIKFIFRPPIVPATPSSTKLHCSKYFSASKNEIQSTNLYNLPTMDNATQVKIVKHKIGEEFEVEEATLFEEA
ncbi:hypothetical protein SAY86_029544 [Trapa natans]|uniref:Uncharacterized protein n=1 Tax=Trapa natans TaxID=22666 RepID=A0AAN7LWK9_TRANT|nr:hypothetical protein SAY86_029544 [Trapa natans]